jgi:hypothetical protein
VRLIQARLQNLRRVGKDFDLGHAGQIRSFRACVKIGGARCAPENKGSRPLAVSAGGVLTLLSLGGTRLEKP